MNDTHICHFVYNPHSLFIGRFYFEATVTDEGLCRVGWSTQQASLELGNHSYQSSLWLYLLVGKDRFGFGFGGTGKKSWNNQFDTYGEVSNWYTVSNSLSLSLSLSLSSLLAKMTQLVAILIFKRIRSVTTRMVCIKHCTS